jgi:hypothetical protein
MLTSCEKDANLELSTSDYLIFGHFYGKCLGEKCIEIFKLENEKLFEDTKGQYPNSGEFYEGIWVQLSQQKFNDTKDLTKYFPTDLDLITKYIVTIKSKYKNKMIKKLLCSIAEITKGSVIIFIKIIGNNEARNCE